MFSVARAVIDLYTNTQDTSTNVKGGGEVNGVKAGVVSPDQKLVYACDKGGGFEAKSYTECEQHGTSCCTLKQGLQLSH